MSSPQLWYHVNFCRCSMLDATLLLLQQSHKWLSKMLIEHISGSYRRQTRNRRMCWCVMAVNKMLQPAKSSWSANPKCVTTVLKSILQSTQSQSQKVNAVQKKSTQGSNKKVNAASTSVNLLTSIFVPMSTAYKNQILHKISAQTDHALTKVNAGQTCPETLTTENLLQ